MNHKFHKITLTLCLLPSFFSASAQENIGAWTSSNLGKCYSTNDEFMSKNFWAGYADDENIIKKSFNGISGDKKYTWIIDATPKINPTRILTSVEKSGKSCIILYAPLSNSISFKIGKTGDLPKEIISEDTPSPGEKKTRIIYKLNDKKIYNPEICQNIDSRNNVKNIGCRDAFTDANQ